MELKNVIRFNRYSSHEAVSAENDISTTTHLSKQFVFERRTASWIEQRDSITYKTNDTIQSTDQMIPSQRFLKQNEKYVHNNMLDKRKKSKTKV